MSVERLRWIWWQWAKLHGLRICAQHHHSARCDDSFRQHAHYTGERADQLAGYTSGYASSQKR
jgi:hypothetical protein